MKQTYRLIPIVLTYLFVACSKPAPELTPTPAPAEDVVTPIAGVYTLSKVTASGSGPAVTGVGSLTITAIDKATAAIAQIRSFTNVSTGAVSKLTNTSGEANKIEKSGSTYLIKTVSGRQWATLSGNKMTTDDYISLSTTTSLTLNTEYTK